MASPPPPPPPAGPNEDANNDKDRLSLPARLLYTLGLPLTTSTLYLLSPPTALFAPLVAGPTALLLHQRNRLPPPQRPGHLEPLTWTFLAAATLAPAVSMAVQSALGYASALLVFGDRTGACITELTRDAAALRALSPEMQHQRRTMAQSPTYAAYLTLFSFLLAGVPEELCKLSILRFLQRRSPSLAKADYILYARAIGLGFSFFENLAFIHVAATTESRGVLLVTAAERILYGTAAHVFTTVLSATFLAQDAASGPDSKDGKGGAKREQRSWWQIILPSALYHGAGNTLLLAACAWDGHPGWVRPETAGKYAKYVVAPVVLMTGLGLQVAREMKKLGIGWRLI